jgi:micrococcal nuclease
MLKKYASWCPIFFLFSNSYVFAEEQKFGPFFGEVVRVIDGDTIEAVVDIWPTIQATVSVRISGIDAPEIWRPECSSERELGIEAARYLDKELPPGTLLRLENVVQDPFPGRVVAEVYRQKDVRAFPVATLLLRQERFIRAWMPGELVIDWCAIGGE